MELIHVSLRLNEGTLVGTSGGKIQPKTAFIIPWGKHEFQTISFAPNNLQKVDGSDFRGNTNIWNPI